MPDSMAPDQYAALQEQLIQTANGAKITRYLNLACWLFCTYDWMLNLDREVELVWKLKFTSMTYFYLFNRYISGIILTISMFTYVQEYYIGDTFCREWWKYEAFSFTICFQLVEFVLGLRVWALWKKSKAIGYLIGTFFLLEALAMLIIIGIYFTNNFTATDTPFRKYGIENFYLCVPTTTGVYGAYVYTFWFPTLAYGTLLSFLAGWVGVKRYRYIRGITRISNRQWLLDIFIRDSLIYYILLALIELSASLFWHFGIGPTPHSVVGFVMALPIVLCSKLILNLRGAYYDYNTDPAWKKLATGPTTPVGSPQGTEMVTFGGTPRFKVAQLSNPKHPMVMDLYPKDSATVFNDDEWAVEHFDQPSKSY